MTFLYMTLNSIGQTVKLFHEFRYSHFGFDLSIGQSSQARVCIRLFGFSPLKSLLMALYYLREKLVAFADGVMTLVCALRQPFDGEKSLF
jgi:hypothetical protein